MKHLRTDRNCRVRSTGRLDRLGRQRRRADAERRPAAAAAPPRCPLPSLRRPRPRRAKPAAAPAPAAAATGRARGARRGGHATAPTAEAGRRARSAQDARGDLAVRGKARRPHGPRAGLQVDLQGQEGPRELLVRLRVQSRRSRRPQPCRSSPRASSATTRRRRSTSPWASTTWAARSARRSPGWEADKLVFTGDGQMGGQKISFRETYTKKGDKELIWSGEMKMGKDWIPVGTDTCKR